MHTWRLQIDSLVLGFDACLLHFVLIKSQENSYQRNRGLINYAKLFFLHSCPFLFEARSGSEKADILFSSGGARGKEWMLAWLSF